MQKQKVKVQNTGGSSDIEAEKKLPVKRIQKQSGQLNNSVNATKASQSTYLQHMKVF
jgi:hypothetical protein